jgi:hypothetical protein
MLCRHSLPDVIMVSGKGWRENMAERNTHTSGICLVWSVCGEAACVDHPSVPASISAFINKERDFHRFGFQFAGVKYRMVSEVRPFCANP